MESWMVQVVVGIATLVAGYAVMKHTVAAHDKKLEKIEQTQSNDRKEFERSLANGVKRFEEISEKVTVLQQTTKEHLGLREAEDRFVSKEMLQLHINNIENTLKHMEKESMAQSKKLDYLTELLSTNIVKTITPHGAVFGGNHG